jgi:hypothetical protein
MVLLCRVSGGTEENYEKIITVDFQAEILTWDQHKSEV